MTSTIEQPQLIAELPDDIFWLEHDIRQLQRVRARGTDVRNAILKPGATRRGGIDIPEDAEWAQGRSAEHFIQSWCDALVCVLQLNLADIPEEARKPEWPRQGVVWLFLQWGGEYRARAEFDPRPAEDIPWRKPAGGKGTGISWATEQSLPWACPETLPSIGHWDYMGKLYDDWMHEHYGRKRRGVVIGGWGFPIQGDFIEDNKDYVCAVDDLEFGDAGEVYLHYNPEAGFYASAFTA